jgi:hypothetical protein
MFLTFSSGWNLDTSPQGYSAAQPFKLPHRSLSAVEALCCQFRSLSFSPRSHPTSPSDKEDTEACT